MQNVPIEKFVIGISFKPMPIRDLIPQIYSTLM